MVGIGASEFDIVPDSGTPIEVGRECEVSDERIVSRSYIFLGDIEFFVVLIRAGIFI